MEGFVSCHTRCRSYEIGEGGRRALVRRRVAWLEILNAKRFPEKFPVESLTS